MIFWVRKIRKKGSNMATVIEVSKLQKSYKNVHVLKDVNFSVEKGTIFALLGSNGSGKTTTINILTTLIKSDNGKALVAGFDVSKQPSKVRERISLTGQFAAVDNRLTGRQNLRLIGDLRHVDDSAKTAKELLNEFGIADAADRKVTTLSGGRRRRLDIAMSLVGNPEIIFLDEPTTGFDPEARNEMWQTIRKLADAGKTVFLTTQYLEEADQLADRIAVLHKGSIVANGSANELKKRIPGGHVELSFQDEKSLSTSIHIFEKHHVFTKESNLKLIINTNGSVAEVADIFMALRDAHIEPAEFSQKEVTLDDVFLKIIGDKKEEK
jgi:ABC-2 type transport system ATP-binding protein